jgi:hypothetical protein
MWKGMLRLQLSLYEKSRYLYCDYRGSHFLSDSPMWTAERRSGRMHSRVMDRLKRRASLTITVIVILSKVAKFAGGLGLGLFVHFLVTID